VTISEKLVRELHGLVMKKDYPLSIILKNDRKKYYQPLVHFVSQAVERSLDIYLKTLTPMTQEREQFYPFSKIAPKINFSPKYLNLLARQGKLEAHKEKRDWLTSLEAVKRYLNSRERKRK